jgi:nucleoside-diphosphate-sugar epimerase
MSEDRSDALIGHTGFVGSNLLRRHQFEATFDSANIDEIRGRNFDLVVCAGVRADKAKANADPAGDLNGIERLTRALEHLNARKLVLISTVDVFIEPRGVDETSTVHMTGLHAYGRNRRLLEEIAASRFDATIVRLPDLYGPGMKQNVIYDFLYDHELDKVDSRGVFQFYDIERLWSDIRVALDLDLPVVHLPPEPVNVPDVARAAFGREFVNIVRGEPARYDVQTTYAPLFGGVGRYLLGREKELEGIVRFARRNGGTPERWTG